MSRAQEIADMPQDQRHLLATKAEWHGWMWWMHDRSQSSYPHGGEDGIEAAKIAIARIEAARRTP